MTIGCVTPQLMMSQARARAIADIRKPTLLFIEKWSACSTRTASQVGTHAVGDRAMDWVVDTYALVEHEKPHSGLRHSIIHANLPTPHAIDVMANLQRKYDAGYPEMQPGFLWWIGAIYAASYGPKRGQRLEPFRTRQSRGVLWSGGSDYFVTPVAARFGLWDSIVRQTAKGTFGLRPLGTAEGGDVKGTIRSDVQYLNGIKRCPPTPFDINQLHKPEALSRQRPRVRVPSSPPFFLKELSHVTPTTLTALLSNSYRVKPGFRGRDQAFFATGEPDATGSSLA